MRTLFRPTRRQTFVAVIVVLLFPTMLAVPAQVQEMPRHGGVLAFAVPSEPPSFDGHIEETFGVAHPISPFYSLLLRLNAPLVCTSGSACVLPFVKICVRCL